MSDPGVAVVIEDDADVRNLVGAVLRQSGFDVMVAPNGKEGVELVRAHDAAVVTLDVGLPDIDGYEVLRRIRGFSNCYVVMLTSRGDELDTLTALQSGADDYLTKPFRPRELRARIAAMLRRPRAVPEVVAAAPAPPARSAEWGPSAAPAPAEPSPVIEHNGLALNASARTVMVDGRELLLTRSEFDLLNEMLRSNGAVRTKADLVRVVRGDYYGEDTYISDSDERAIEVHIGNLRRKLDEDPKNPRWLQTVRGVGYRLTPGRA
ncbi:response regulator transcription factor [Arthrobacter sp. TMS2-4]